MQSLLMAQPRISDLLKIDEVRAYQRELWNICNDKGTFQRVKAEAVSKLLDCTARLVELYDAIPIVTAIRDYGLRIRS